MKKILLTFMGILCALSSVWADDITLYSIDFTALTPDDALITSAKTTNTLTGVGTPATDLQLKGYKNSAVTIDATNGLTFTGNNLSASAGAASAANYYIAIPVSGVNGSLTVTTTGDATKWYYTYTTDADQSTIVGRQQASANNGFTITGLTNSNVTIYIGSSAKKIKTLTVTTPAEKTQWDAPTFSVGAWNSADQAYPVTISAEDGATISYKIGDGDYQTYSAPVNVAANATIYAKATGGTLAESAVASKTMAGEPAKYEEYKADNESNNKCDFTGSVFAFSRAGTTVAQDFSAAENENDGLTFTNAFLPNGSTSATNCYTLTAKQKLSKIVVYYTSTDSKFATQDQSKSGNLMYQIGDNDAVTSTTGGNKSNKVAYKEVIEPNGGIAKDTEVKIYSSGNRLAIFCVRVYADDDQTPAATYSITYHNNGHGTAPTNVESATTLPNPLPTMSETGWNFDGWFTDEALSVAAVAGAALTANADLYAKWTEKGPATYPLVATWDFTKLTESYDHTTGQMESNGADDNYSATLEIDATNGKLGANGNSAQFNAGTYLKVPVTSTADIVSAKNYNYNQSEDHILINGTPISEAAGYNANADDVNNGYVTVYSDRNNTYIVSVTLTKNDPTVYPVKEGNVYTVAKDSKESLSIALSLVKSGEEIYIPNGTYDFGTEENITISASNVTITGESMEGVIIKNTPAVEGLKKGLFYNKGTNNVFKNLTLQSYAPWGSNGGQSAERAHALWDEGNKTVCENVYLKGRQDTYLSNNKDMTAYFVGGKIEGTTDFICGSGKVFFEGVELYCANSEHKTSGDVIIAPQPLADSKADVTNYGYVFNNCVINGEASQNGTYHLGRGWGQTTGSEVDEWIYAMFANTRMNIAYKTQTAGAMNGSVLTINEQAAAANSIETNKNGVASFVSVVPMDFTDAEGITAYLCTNVTAEAVTLVKAEKVPAGTAFVVVGDKETEYTVPFTAYATTLYNLFKAGAYTVKANENVYALNSKGQFQKVAAGVTVPVGKAYLKTDVALTKTISIIDEDTTTGINAANSEVVKGVRKAIVDGQLRIVTPNGMFTTTGAQVK